jgi:DNA invertase Pin-like site-specific DNA recombinase
MLTHDVRSSLHDVAHNLKMKYLKEVFEPIIRELFKEIRAEENKDKPLLTIADIATKFKVTKATVHNWKNRGLSEGVKVGKNRYFTEEEVKKALSKFGYLNKEIN